MRGPGEATQKIMAKGESASERDTVRDTVKDTVKLTGNQRGIMTAVKGNPSITAKELSLILGINLRNTKNNISKLKKKGLLKRIGPDKGGCWKVLRQRLKSHSKAYT